MLLDPLQPYQRPTPLAFACLFSFFGSFILLIFYAYTAYEIANMDNISVYSDNDLVKIALGPHYDLALTGAVAAPLRILGVYGIWNRKKIGFFLYAFTCLGELLCNLHLAASDLDLVTRPIDWLLIFGSAFFISIYGIYTYKNYH